MKRNKTILRSGLLFLSLAALVVLIRENQDSAPGSASQTTARLSEATSQGATTAIAPANSANSVVPASVASSKQSVREPAFEQFRDWAQAYLNASTPEKAALESKGVELARARHVEMAALIQSNPEHALEIAVPDSIRRALPNSVSAQLEKRVSGQGALSVFGTLPQPGKANEAPATFRTASVGGNDYKAFVYGRRLGQPTRNNLPLNGVALDNLLAVNANPVRVLEPAEAAQAKSLAKDAICGVSGLAATINNEPTAVEAGGEIGFVCQTEHVALLNDRLVAAEGDGPTGGSNPGDVESSVWTEGTKNLILIRVDFSDLAGVPFPDSTGTNMVKDLGTFYREMSYGRTTFAPLGGGSEMTPTLRMPKAAAWYGTNNNYLQLRTDARAAATTAGYNLGSFDRDLICFGAVPGWGWAGLGYVGAAGVWLRSYFTAGVAGHELGHNAGLNHANFWDTSGASVIGPGSNIEYGDTFDTMGNANAGYYQFNVRNKVYLNWLTTNEWVNVTSNGTYRIYCHDDTNSVGLRGIRVAKNASTNYWVEFRQKFTGNKWLMNGAGLRLAANGNIQSLLLDTTPGSVSAKNDSAVLIGRTYVDPDSQIYITPVGFGNTSPQSLDVAVNLGSFPGNRAPSVTVAASATNAAVGGVLTFTASASDPDGDSLAYFWDFGDDSFGTNGTVAAKSWASAGEYLVRCVVTDKKGGEASASRIVVVGSPTTYRISGRVTTPAGGLEGVRVYASSTRMSYTDSDGTYTIVGLPAGTYTAAASLYEYNLVGSGFVNPVSVGPNAANIDFLATSTVATPPSIITQPFGQTVNQGAAVAFSVAANGTQPMSYQWRLNGGAIAGATGSSYSRTNVQSGDAGNYSVAVNNTAGSAASTNAPLVVNVVQILASIRSSNGLAVISWNSVSGKTYAVQYKMDLTATNWTALTPDVVASGSSASKTDPLTGTRRFYRVLQY